MRAAQEKEIIQNIQAQGLGSYNEMLIQEYRNSSNEVYIVSMGFTLMCSHFTSNCLDFFI